MLDSNQSSAPMLVDAKTKPRKPGFQKGKAKTGGRITGVSTNKHNRVLKEALMIAAELEGSDTKGRGKLVGFLRRVAREDMRAFCSMLSRVIPLQVDHRSDEKSKEEVVYKSVEEVQRELASRGISMEFMVRMAKMEEEDDNDDAVVIDNGSPTPRED